MNPVFYQDGKTTDGISLQAVIGLLHCCVVLMTFYSVLATRHV